jgi:hypothetical protein
VVRRRGMKKSRGLGFAGAEGQGLERRRGLGFGEKQRVRVWREAEG